eukprot:12028892-Prorocentrum_lima.AAC.1
MTSSLVGSEMCIRDSLATLFGACHQVPQLSDGLASHRLLWVAQIEAVSYTHLTLPTICSV